MKAWPFKCTCQCPFYLITKRWGQTQKDKRQLKVCRLAKKQRLVYKDAKPCKSGMWRGRYLVFFLHIRIINRRISSQRCLRCRKTKALWRDRQKGTVPLQMDSARVKGVRQINSSNRE